MLSCRGAGIVRSGIAHGWAHHSRFRDSRSAVTRSSGNSKKSVGRSTSTFRPSWQTSCCPLHPGRGRRGRRAMRAALMREMVRTHHERIDGAGYPDAIKGDSIPLLGRIGAIIDSYDAMISSRAYGETLSAFDAVRERKRVSGAHLDRALVDRFIQAVGVFPTGSLCGWWRRAWKTGRRMTPSRAWGVTTFRVPRAGHSRQRRRTRRCRASSTGSASTAHSARR